MKLKEKIISAQLHLEGIQLKDTSKQKIIDLAKAELELTADNVTENQLLKKIVKVNHILQPLRIEHSMVCILEDTESLAPCDCGAKEQIDALEKAKKELELSM